MKRKEETKELLIVVDMVNGFIREGVMSSKNIERIIPGIKLLVRRTLYEDGSVAFIKDTHDENSLEFKKFPPHCIKGTSECELVNELKPYEKDALVYEKNSTSTIFAPNFLKDIDSMKNLKEVTVVGCCSDICVLNLVIPLINYFDQNDREVKVNVYSNYIETYDAENHNAKEYNAMALKLMKQAGASIDYEKFNIVLCDKDLFLENVYDFENDDFDRSRIPYRCGIESKLVDGKRKYAVYCNDDFGATDTYIEFDNFEDALNQARYLYRANTSINSAVINDHADINKKKEQYFTNENKNIIYKRLKEEANIIDLPFLGNKVEYGLGNICLEESDNVFKFYIIDRASKFEYEEFDNIKDAIERLVKSYEYYELVKDPDKMREIFYQTLGLEKEQNLKLKS